MPFAMHRGQRIHYTVAGDGPVVVLQHGQTTGRKVWKPEPPEYAPWPGSAADVMGGDLAFYVDALARRSP